MSKKLVAKPKEKPVSVLRVTCRAAAMVPISKLTRLQGDLKTLSPADRERLKKSLVENGVSFPVHAWDSGKTIYILDGTQRTDVIREIAGEEFKVPVAWVEAKDKKEAARKLLAAASQYGEVTKDGLLEFVKEFKIDAALLMDNFRFPEIDLSKFVQVNFPTYSDGESEGGDIYTKKIAIPVYEPKGEEPKISELFSNEKAEALVEEIEKAKIDPDVKEFLIRAAQRHVVFDYEKIAEFYCHQPKKVQDLMEKSALVLIDFDKAIENGFIKMVKDIAEVANVDEA